MRSEPLTSREELVARLENLRSQNGGSLCIGLDGMDGVGKSTLARELADRLGGSVISLDDHLTRKQNGYILHIRGDELKAAISASRSPMVIEGVCLLGVAHRCGFDVEVLVYVRRLSRNSGIWHEEELCMAQRPADELKENERALRKAFSTTDEPGNIIDDDLGLTGELIDYHARWRPVERADFVFDVSCD
ncbi:hypothetical protein [Bradyrhizobium sp. CSS354]|uniref:hypothetical protein n=1 Tax=Bradyrhizobium sp. CSS354 TaxID=2699172 RepID=UPI0023AF4FBE|nr:hypothetical protein [Bradyrhizobium sp. CSS354]MDE5461164.1 hypothetical protein [Bradyrhizobium sp. CSS354]